MAKRPPPEPPALEDALRRARNWRAKFVRGSSVIDMMSGFTAGDADVILEIAEKRNKRLT